MNILECEQYSEIWWNAHRGVPTASNFDKIITPKTGKLSAQADDLICELIAQKATRGSICPSGYISPAMLNGTIMEPEARNYYELVTGTEVRQVGMVFTDDGRFGASPDGMVGDQGGLELKCPQLKTQVKYLLDGGLPVEYKPQCHGFLVVSGLPWIDFMSYAPGLEPLIVRVVPDAFTEQLRAALESFWTNYQAALAKVKISV